MVLLAAALWQASTCCQGHKWQSQAGVLWLRIRGIAPHYSERRVGQSGWFRMTRHAENINGGRRETVRLETCEMQWKVHCSFHSLPSPCTVAVLRFDLIPKVLRLPKPPFHLTLVIWNIFSFKPQLWLKTKARLSQRAGFLSPAFENSSRQIMVNKCTKGSLCAYAGQLSSKRRPTTANDKVLWCMRVRQIAQISVCVLFCLSARLFPLTRFSLLYFNINELQMGKLIISDNYW